MPLPAPLAFFSSLANRDGWEGGCETIWRFAHDAVRHALSARKPFVATKENIPLKKGIPVKILWRKRAAGSEPAQQPAAAASSGSNPIADAQA